MLVCPCVLAQYRGLHVYNTHWDHESSSARSQSARLLLSRLPRLGSSSATVPDSEKDDPVVVTGDLNAPVSEDSVQTLLSGGLVDVLTHAHPAEASRATYHAWTGSDGSPYHHIDYIMVSVPVGTGEPPAVVCTYPAALPVPPRQVSKAHLLGDKRGTIVSAHVDRGKYDGRWPSDHFPVVAEVVL